MYILYLFTFIITKKPSNVATQSRKNTHKKNNNRTHSRILNDIATLDPKLSTTFSESTTSTVSDDYHQNKNMDKTVANHISIPFIDSQLHNNPNSLLISNIIANQTTVTANDVKSQSPSWASSSPFNNLKNMNENAFSSWNFNNDPIQFRTTKSKSVWDKPISISPKISDIDTSIHTAKSARTTKSKSASNIDEASFNPQFQFRVQPKLVEMERVPINIDNKPKLSLSSIICDPDPPDANTIGDDESVEIATLKLLPTQISVDSIYNPLTCDMSRISGSNGTVQFKKDSMMTPTDFSTPTPQNHKPVTPLTLSSDFAVIDVIVERKKEESIRAPLMCSTNDTPTVSVAQSSKESKVSTLTLGSITNTPTINPHKLTEIIRSPSVFDRYRENLSLDDRQKLLVVVMTKYTILALCAVVTTQLFVIMGLVTTLLSYHKDQNNTFDDKYDILISILKMIYYLLWSIDCVIGTLCCYLNFKMNDIMYHKLFKCCDNKCRKICGEIAKKKIVEAKIDDRAETLHQYLLKDSKNGHNHKRKFVH